MTDDTDNTDERGGRGEREHPAGMPPKGEARTAWEDQGSLVERLKSPRSRGSGKGSDPSGGDGGPDAGSGSGDPRVVDAGGSPGAGDTHETITGDVAETARRADSRQRSDAVRGRLQGRAGQEVRGSLARASLARRGGEDMRGMGEIEEAQRIVLEESHPEELTPDAEKKAARMVALAFTISALGSLAFLVLFVVLGSASLRTQNTLFGLTLGTALLGVGFAGILWVKKIMPHEESVQMREELHPTPEQRRAVELDWARGIEEAAVSRRKAVLLGSMGLGTGLLALPPLFLLRDLGPSPTGGAGKSVLAYTAWRRDMRFVDYDTQRPVKLGEIGVGSLMTVVPEGHADAAGDSSVMLIRLRPGTWDMKPFDDYAAKWKGSGFKGTDFIIDGHIAYSKICTHAGCPVSLYQQQLSQFLCPCHQSTFKAVDAGKVIFGPAARALPMLPFYVDEGGYFRALGDFPEPVGPSFWERG